MAREFYLPYLLNYTQPVVEEIVIYCVAFLTAVVVSAEGQGFMATILGDSKPDRKDRHHFNVFLHMSLLGTLNFFIAGFGWTKEVNIDSGNFKKYPRFFLVLSRLAGPFFNLLLANIAASLSWILGRWGFDDQVFSSIVVVNVTMALYGLLIIPPLPGFALLSAFLPSGRGWEKIREILGRVGPFLIIGTFLIFRLTDFQGVAALFNPVVSAVTTFILDI